MTKRISVFGGSKPKVGEAAYEQAQRLGSMLGLAGYTVLTGGYIGTMEAVSRGASETGTHVIGVTCEEIESYRPGKANRWVEEEMRFVTLRERIYAMIDGCDAAIALPGGVGTLTEISMTWNHMLIEAVSPRPLILIGIGWQAVLEAFTETLTEYVPEEHQRWLFPVPSVDAAFRLLQQEVEGER